MKLCPECNSNFINDDEEYCSVCKPEARPGPEPKPYPTPINIKNNMTKKVAINLLKHEGYVIYDEVTFASKNSTINCYWANPRSDVIKYNWSLILNDYYKRKLYLLNIPAYSIAADDLFYRSDRDVVDLEIEYGSSSFKDGRSGLPFIKYLVCSVDY